MTFKTQKTQDCIYGTAPHTNTQRICLERKVSKVSLVRQASVDGPDGLVCPGIVEHLVILDIQVGLALVATLVLAALAVGAVYLAGLASAATLGSAVLVVIPDLAVYLAGVVSLATQDSVV